MAEDYVIDKLYTTLDFLTQFSELLRNNQFTEIDQRLADLPVENVPPEVLVATLRCTYPLRFQLSNWPALLKNVRKELIRVELDAEKILTGLNPKENS